MIALLLASLAFAGDDNPWGDAPATPPPAPPATVPAAAVPEVPPPASEVAHDGAAPTTPPPAKLPPPASSAPPPMESYTFTPMGAGSSMRVAEALVVGRAGGTDATTLSVRSASNHLGFGVSLPFAAYRKPDGRDVDIGNLQLQTWFSTGHGRLKQQLGVRAHLHLGSRAWTWTDHADELWPGEGVMVEWQGEREGNTTLMYRAAFGLDGAKGYKPYPGFYAQFQAGFALDQKLTDKVGITGEALLTYWDLSPIECTALVRWDPLDGIRVRGGLVLPLAVWMGATPSHQKAGLSETTFLFDLSAHI